MLTKTNITPLDLIRRDNDDAVGAIRRTAYVAQRSFANFWDGDKAHRLAAAAALNEFATTVGNSSAGIFAEHAATAQYCIARLPELAGGFRLPPVDMAAVYDADGMIDLALFESALDALEA